MGDRSKEIKELEEKLFDLKEEQKNYDSLREDKKLADYIHSKTCKLAHEDYCGWFYENWEKPGYSRQSYLEKAQKILKVTSFDIATKVIDCF